MKSESDKLTGTQHWAIYQTITVVLYHWNRPQGDLRRSQTLATKIHAAIMPLILDPALAEQMAARDPMCCRRFRWSWVTSKAEMLSISERLTKD